MANRPDATMARWAPISGTIATVSLACLVLYVAISRSDYLPEEKTLLLNVLLVGELIMLVGIPAWAILADRRDRTKSVRH